jgi:predicted NBD/HSP70 family sugar kinase
MYVGIDIGGTKTLVASLDDNGVIQEQFRFKTPDDYPDFLKKLAENVARLTTKDFTACGVGAPGKINRVSGHVLAFGRRPWKDVPLRDDIARVVNCPTAIDNDANIAGLSEAMLAQDYRKVLYVTVSTGIGTGFIVEQKIDPEMADSEGGDLMMEHKGKLQRWEDFASGHAIVDRFGKKAEDIDDDETWHIIAHDLARGMIDLIALMEPDLIVLGGSVGTHYHKYGDFLNQYLQEYANPMLTIPPIKEAARPEEAVVYGCYDLAKQYYGQPA